MSPRTVAAILYAVLFDMDGTLVTTHLLHAESWARALEDLGLDGLREDDTALIHGVPREQGAWHLLARKSPGFEQLTRAKQRALAQSLGSLKQFHYLRLLQAAKDPSAPLRVELHRGVPELIAELRLANCKIGVATASRNAPAVLQTVGLAAAFDVVVSPADVPAADASKTDVFRLARARLPVDPRGVVAVEDASSGVEAARAAGMPCVAVLTTESAEALRAAGADAIVPDPSHITIALLESVIAAYWAGRAEAA
jgi:beta-phosphoglucomutase